MKKSQYKKEREKILRYYERIEKEYIRRQESSAMLVALQHEKNDRLLELAEAERKELLKPVEVKK